MLKRWLKRTADEQTVFLFLLSYRWLSLLPPLLALGLATETDPNIHWVFLAAFVDNFFLTVFYPRVNRLVTHFPIVFGIDLVIVAVFIALTGNVSSLYYLYALSPLLAAAFFFQMRGALLTASALTIFYGLTALPNFSPADLLRVLTQIISFYLIAMLFGYASILMNHIREDRALLARNNAILERTNRELESIHNLALMMQSSAVDVADVQEIVLTTITNAMGFERATLALVDPERNTLIGWLMHRRDEGAQTPAGLFHTTEIPLDHDAGVLARVTVERKPAYVADGLPPTNDPAMNQRLGFKQYAILPLYMRDHPVGVLVVDNPGSGAPISPESIRSLESVAEHAAIALGSTKLCIERAQRLAVEEERNRIAMEIHDTASQSLFGIVYTLDGCIKLLPAQSAQVQTELVALRDVAARTLSDLRRSLFNIWDGALSEMDFNTEIMAYLQKLGPPKSLAVQVEVKGTFNLLAASVRKNVLRIAQEGLANVVKHSGATRAVVTLDLQSQPPHLVVEDNGCGFEAHETGTSHTGFGLTSMRERAHAIGGDVQIQSHAQTGTRIEVQLHNCVPLAPEKEPNANPTCG
ncbi:MAG: GAF domain-containing protein [Chloroflexi bacterium]|nr:GAF domain-containing protein [Chloroflexota bacterium]